MHDGLWARGLGRCNDFIVHDRVDYGGLDNCDVHDRHFGEQRLFELGLIRERFVIHVVFEHFSVEHIGLVEQRQQLRVQRLGRRLEDQERATIAMARAIAPGSACTK